MGQQIRQGDVLLIPVGEIPKEAKKQKRDNGRVILAYGEVTGHAHAITKPNVTKLAVGIAGYLNAPTGCVLEHEEHSAITIEPGAYKIVHQREYHPEAIRRVAD